jgi:putative GTP pyrophosphokinase
MADEEKTKLDVETVLTQFDSKQPVLTRFCETTKGLIETCLQSSTIRFQSVQKRVKGREKLREKYLDPKKDYKQLDDITDQAALRVITYYEDEVDRVAEVIKREFDVDPKNSVDKRDTDPEKFGYYALNLVCQYLAARTYHIEYREFRGISCEIQITSILRHAWSEIEHPWYDFKDAFPPEIKRRFARMAALLEIAESEFLMLRKVQADYKQSVDIQVQAAVPSVPLDAVSMRSFIEQDRLVAAIDESIASLLSRPLSSTLTERFADIRVDFAKAAGMMTLPDLRESLMKYREWVLEYVEECRRRVWRDSAPKRPLEKGICITHLSVLLLSIRGASGVSDELLKLGIRLPPKEIAGQVDVAERIAAKYSGQ